MPKYSLSITILLALLFGFLFPDIGSLWKNYLTPILMGIMFLTILKIPSNEILSVNKKILLTSIILVFGFMPILTLPFKFLQPLLFLGLVTAISCPSAAAVAFFSESLRGDGSLGLSVSTITTILSIFLTPFLVLVIAGSAISVDYFKIFETLVKVILLPIIIALIFKKLFRRPTNFLIKKSMLFSFILFFFLNWGFMAVGMPFILENFYNFLYVQLILILIVGIGYIVGYFIGKYFGKDKAVTLSISTGMKNSMLSFVIILEGFGHLALLPIIANIIAQLGLIIPVEILKKS
ncbi:MAG: hypothetical protein QMD36_02435 [Candidatus Aenigmarchaeota archaeon]|nr:hypothetical protein [Candidatus Aenigmarchaeota archaeon]